jgi:hypothetical protein
MGSAAARHQLLGRVKARAKTDARAEAALFFCHAKSYALVPTARGAYHADSMETWTCNSLGATLHHFFVGGRHAFYLQGPRLMAEKVLQLLNLDKASSADTKNEQPR